MEEKLQKQEKVLDYLAPFLIQMDNPVKLTRHQAYKLREDCLNNLKQRLIDKANLIQSRYEEVFCNCLITSLVEVGIAVPFQLKDLQIFPMPDLISDDYCS